MESSSAYKKRVTTIIHELKYMEPSESTPVIPVFQNKKVIATLRVITKEMLKNPQVIMALASWRRKSNQWFPAQFRVTNAGTKRWGKAQLLEKEDRILFFVEDLAGGYIGHVGLYRFDFDTRSCEVDNIIRGRAGIPGVMTHAIKALCAWGKDQLGIRTYFLRVVSHNRKAVNLYTRVGFKEVGKIPMKKVVQKGVVIWEELEQGHEKEAKRFDLHMKRI